MHLSLPAVLLAINAVVASTAAPGLTAAADVSHQLRGGAHRHAWRLSASPAQDKPQDKPQDVSGTWALTVETANGTGNPSVTLKQDGGKLTGNYSSPLFGEQKVTGTIKGSAFTFSFTGSIEGNTLTVTYSGTVEKDTMKGKVTLGDLGEGTFTGQKK